MQLPSFCKDFGRANWKPLNTIQHHNAQTRNANAFTVSHFTDRTFWHVDVWFETCPTDLGLSEGTPLGWNRYSSSGFQWPVAAVARSKWKRSSTSAFGRGESSQAQAAQPLLANEVLMDRGKTHDYRSREYGFYNSNCIFFSSVECPSNISKPATNRPAVLNPLDSKLSSSVKRNGALWRLKMQRNVTMPWSYMINMVMVFQCWTLIESEYSISMYFIVFLLQECDLVNVFRPWNLESSFFALRVKIHEKS